MEEKYKKVGLMQLRIYARSIGVKAPTVYTKPELIEKITRIENGIDKPYLSKRGRPRINETKVKDTQNNIQIKRKNLFEYSKKEIKGKLIEAKTKKEIEKKIKEIKVVTQEYFRNLEKILNE